MNAASVLLTGLSLRICFTEELGCDFHHCSDPGQKVKVRWRVKAKYVLNTVRNFVWTNKLYFMT